MEYCTKRYKDTLSETLKKLTIVKKIPLEQFKVKDHIWDLNRQVMQIQKVMNELKKMSKCDMCYRIWESCLKSFAKKYMDKVLSKKKGEEWKLKDLTEFYEELDAVGWNCANSCVKAYQKNHQKTEIQNDL